MIIHQYLFVSILIVRNTSGTKSTRSTRSSTLNRFIFLILFVECHIEKGTFLTSYKTVINFGILVKIKFSALNSALGLSAFCSPVQYIHFYFWQLAKFRDLFR